MIKLPAYFTGFSSRSDGSAGLRFTTQELNEMDFAELKKNHNAFGWLLFSENPISEKDLPSENAEEEGISTSERLRRRAFVYWQHKINDGDFNSWYRRYIESIGNKLLEQIQ